MHPQHRVELGPLRVIGENGEPPPPPSYLTIREHHIEPLPDQSGIPFWDQEWIAPELKELLFGPSEEKETELKTYFIVDAALRKKVTGFFDLDKVKLPVRCLFKGEAAQTLKQHAPYLIDMSLPEGALEDRDLVPDFHKDFFKKHWEQGTGIFIRSKASMDQVLKHFRRFTRIQVEEDKRWVLFRFWDPRIAPHYFESIEDSPEKALQWGALRDGGRIEQIIGKCEDDSDRAWRVIPSWDNLKGVTAPALPMLSNLELEGFVKYKKKAFINELLIYFKEKDTFHANVIGDEGLKEVISLGIDKAKIYGLTRKSPVKLYIHMMLYLGSYFDEDPLLSWARDILKSSEFDGWQLQKANTLRSGFIDYLETVSGKKGEYLQSFMRACQEKMNKTEENISQKAMLSFIKTSYPQKYHYLGFELLLRLINHCDHLCTKNGFHSERSVLFLVCLRLVYGARMIDDPLFPWMKNVFEADTEKNNKDALFQKVTSKFLTEIIQYIEGE